MGDFSFASSELLANRNTDTFFLVSAFPFSLLVPYAPFVCDLDRLFLRNYVVERKQGGQARCQIYQVRFDNDSLGRSRNILSWLCFAIDHFFSCQVHLIIHVSGAILFDLYMRYPHMVLLFA